MSKTEIILNISFNINLNVLKDIGQMKYLNRLTGRELSLSFKEIYSEISIK